MPKPGEGMRMRVQIDQDLCTGDGLCEQIAPAVFVLADDGLSYVKEGDRVYNDAEGGDGVVVVPTGFEDAVVAASQECPGECIFVTRD
jgi:ferredoxin